MSDKQLKYDIIGRFYISPLVPREIAAMLKPILLQWKGLPPRWCERVFVVWDDEDKENAAHCRAYYDYRNAVISVCPNFLTIEDRREENIVHEIVHILIDPLWNSTVDMTAELIRARPEMEKLIQEHRRHALEQAVVDLTSAFMGRIPPQE